MGEISDEIQSYVLGRSKEEIISELRDEMVCMSPEAHQRAEKYIKNNEDNVEELRLSLAEQLHGLRSQLGDSRKRRKSKRRKKKSKRRKSCKSKTRRKKRSKTERIKLKGGADRRSLGTVLQTNTPRDQIKTEGPVSREEVDGVTTITHGEGVVILDNHEEIERYVLGKLGPQYNALSPEKRNSIFKSSLLYSHQFDGFHNRLIRNYHNSKTVSLSLFDKTLLQSSEELSIFLVKGTFKFERKLIQADIEAAEGLLKTTRTAARRDKNNRYARLQVPRYKSELTIAQKNLEIFDDGVGEFKSGEFKSDEFPFVEDCLVQNTLLNREIERAKESDNKPLFCLQKCSFLHKNMKDNSLVLDRSITVYRGIFLGRTTQYLEGGFNNKLTGFSSTTYKMTQAISYLIGHRLPDEFEDEEYDSDKLKAGLSKMIILKIKLNPGTHVFYTDICGKDETELTLLDEGSLNMGTETSIEVSKDQFLNDIGIAGEYTGDEESFPSISLKQIECEFVPNQEQIDYSEVLFDPLSQLMI